jgi:hypothetical protein
VAVEHGHALAVASLPPLHRDDALVERRGQAGAEAAQALGRLLNDRVRFEERELFGMVEARLSEDELARLGEAVARAHS